jgi:hypothetical protein
VADDNDAVLVDHNGLAKAELLDRGRHGVDRASLIRGFRS